jgi:Fic family protein
MFEELTRKRQQIDSFRPLSKTEVERLEHQKKIEHVWSSNAIEGNTLTEYETASIMETGLTIAGKPVKEHLEVLDLSEAFDYMKSLATSKRPITSTDIRDLNRLVTYGTAASHAEAGSYRQIDVWPAGYESNKYLSPVLIPDAVEKFVSNFNENINNMHPVNLAAWAHFTLVSIHPFIDGNGRTSRLLMNMVLVRFGYPIINIQPDSECRITYMETLRDAQLSDNSTSFVQLVAEYENHELDLYLDVLKRHEAEVSRARKATNLPDSFFED